MKFTIDKSKSSSPKPFDKIDWLAISAVLASIWNDGLRFSVRPLIAIWVAVLSDKSRSFQSGIVFLVRLVKCYLFRFDLNLGFVFWTKCANVYTSGCDGCMTIVSLILMVSDEKSYKSDSIRTESQQKTQNENFFHHSSRYIWQFAKYYTRLQKHALYWRKCKFAWYWAFIFRLAILVKLVRQKA